MLCSCTSKKSRSLLLFGSFLLMLTMSASAQEKMPPKRETNDIRLSLEQIPAPPASLPVFRLSAQKPPTEFVQEVLRRSDPKAGSLVPLGKIPQLLRKGEKAPEEIIGALTDGRLGAYVNLKTGDAEIFPSLTRQKAVSGEQEEEVTERVGRIARETLGRADLLSKDATQFSFEKPRPLFGETAERGETGAEVKASKRGIYLTYVTARRSVEGKYFVYGPGSRALLAIGNDGSIQGLQRRWKVAAPSGEVRETRSREEVAEAIRTQLRPATKEGEVEVLGTEIAYYDGHREFLQPVYKFTARIQEIRP